MYKIIHGSFVEMEEQLNSLSKEYESIYIANKSYTELVVVLKKLPEPEVKPEPIVIVEQSIPIVKKPWYKR